MAAVVASLVVGTVSEFGEGPSGEIRKDLYRNPLQRPPRNGYLRHKRSQVGAQKEPAVEVEEVVVVDGKSPEERPKVELQKEPAEVEEVVSAKGGEEVEVESEVKAPGKNKGVGEADIEAIANAVAAQGVCLPISVKHVEKSCLTLIG